MKKILSLITAICIMLMTSVTAFAAEVPSSEKVKAQIDGAAAYITKDVQSYGVDQALDFCMIADSGADVSKYKDGFIKDVKSNLDANKGKIVSAYGENLTTYGAVIIALTALDEDISDFYGYDIGKAFLAMDPTAEPVSLNYYRIITQGAFYCENSDEFLTKVCDTYIANHYTMGKGVDYYGYSCDNTAYFIDAVSYGYYATDKYEDILKDAIAVLDTYKVDGGYCFNPEYGKETNADSTALALMAHSGYIADPEHLDKHYETVNGIYADLCKFEGSGTGIFTYDGDDSIYTTKEALIALSYYYWDVIFQEIPDDEPPTDDGETTTAVTSEPTTAKPKTTVSAANTSKKSPATGSNTAAVSAAAAFIAATGMLAVLKKKEK